MKEKVGGLQPAFHGQIAYDEDDDDDQIARSTLML